jgi:2-methylisocitrate lyase-like PEP mutase family enzyme
MTKTEQSRRGFIKGAGLAGAGLAAGGVVGSTVFPQPTSAQSARAGGGAASMSKGARFRAAVANPAGLVMPVVNSVLMARLVEHEGFQGALLAPGGETALLGRPNGTRTITEIIAYMNEVMENTNLPIMAYVNDGGGSPIMVYDTVQQLERGGAAVVTIEDTVDVGSYLNVKGAPLVSTEQMVNRIKAAVDARKDQSMMIMMRTALVAKGYEEQRALDLAAACVEAGADALNFQGFTLDQQLKAKNLLKKPMMMGSTIPPAEWKAKGIDMAYYHVENVGIGAIRVALQELKTTGVFTNAAKMQLPPELTATLIDSASWQARAKKYGVMV